MHELLMAVASPCCRAQALGHVVVVHRLSCPMVCGIFPDQGINPCPPAMAGGFLTTGPPEKSPNPLAVEESEAKVKVTQSCPILCDPMEFSRPEYWSG